jgi:hypothetical protein
MNTLNEWAMRQEPFSDTVVIQEMKSIRAVGLSWRGDNAADAYLVMRSIFDENGFQEFLPIFKGGEKEYVDHDIAIAVTYAYRLDKIKGDKVFEGATCVYYTRPEPFPGVITTQSLNNGLAVYLTWEPDIGADEYRVMRTVNDGAFQQFVQRHDGAGFFLQGTTSAIDIVEDDRGYLYRLDKRCGSVWIIGQVITEYARTRPLPFGDTPTVENFRPSGDIFISWRYDDGVDSYILMRRDDPPTVDFEPVYTGNELHYLDTGVITVQQQGRYVYKLYKKRNEIIYRWDDKLAYGVAEWLQEDKQEPNNTEESATILESDMQATLYCYGFYNSNYILEDIDWYKVNIPPKTDAYIAINYTKEVYSEYLSLYIPDTELTPIVHAISFHVRNNDIVQKYVPFAIVPTKSKFLPSPTGEGGAILAYNIKLEQIK